MVGGRGGLTVGVVPPGVQEVLLVEQLHLADCVVGCDDASPDAAVHYLALEDVGEAPGDAHEECLAVD